MPTCMTCRGEYRQQDCICPSCNSRLGRSVNLCHHCGSETGGQRLCPRCKSDVSAWEHENQTLVQFITQRGGWVGLMPLVVALGLWATWGMEPDNAIHHPIASLLSMMVSALVFYSLYGRRLRLRERGWAAEVFQVRGPALASIGLYSLATGGLCMVILVSMQKAWLTPTFEHKLLFALFYTATFGSFTGGLTLLPLGNYLSKLNERMPQPIFVHTDRLFDIVIKTVAKSIKDRSDSGEEKTTVSDFEIIEVTRNPVDGGIQGLVKEHKQIQHTNLTSGKPVYIEMIWAIDADRWGRLRSVKPGQAESGTGQMTQHTHVLGGEPNMRDFNERD